jgi:hypothetical protein
MRQQRTEPAAIEAEIARLRSLALDAFGGVGGWSSDERGWIYVYQQKDPSETERRNGAFASGSGTRKLNSI